MLVCVITSLETLSSLLLFFFVTEYVPIVDIVELVATSLE